MTMSWPDAERLILASGSTTRRDLLTSAGIAIEVVPAKVDEPALRQAILEGQVDVARQDISQALASAKAVAVSASRPEALVIGADQILTFGQEVLEKPASIADARACLAKLRGQTHQLHSSMALARAGAVIWTHTSTATLTMRDFSDARLEAYLEEAGDEVLTSVGAYQIEGPAIQLFEQIDGDYTTILGLPLLPLLAELRRQKVLAQ